MIPDASLAASNMPVIVGSNWDDRDRALKTLIQEFQFETTHIVLPAVLRVRFNGTQYSSFEVALIEKKTGSEDG
jgi:hypothetical protein